MLNKRYVYVGNWGFAPAPKGISIFKYDEDTGELALMETIRPDIAAGQLCMDSDNHILYAVNECGDQRDKIGGGGYVLAFRADPESGRLTQINEQPSILPEPSYLCLDKSKKYVMACHCSDPWHVTKLRTMAGEPPVSEVLFDDTGVVLFPVLADGSVGPACDVMLTGGNGDLSADWRKDVDPVSGHIQLVRVISRLHSVMESPDGNMYVTCDKGMDRVITFRLDRENGKLTQLHSYPMEELACFPRYGVFHPHLPFFYSNNENLAMLHCFSYKSKEGSLRLEQKVRLLFSEVGLVDGKPVGAQDILIHPNGRFMYVSLCGLNMIAVLSVDESGHVELKQNIPSGGILPRGLALSPDGCRLLSGNMVSGDITTFTLDTDGTLIPTGKKYKAVSPSAIRFL